MCFYGVIRGSVLAVVAGLVIGTATAQEAAPKAETDGTIESLAFDTASSEVEVLAMTVDETTEGTDGSASVSPDAGPGIIPEDLLEKLASSNPTFAPYELREGTTDQQGNFVPKSVIEPDTREIVVDTTAFPASATVSISFISPVDGLNYGCSGAMVSPDTVLTAGHCVFDGGWSRSVIVLPGRNGVNQPFGSCNAVNLFTLRAWADALPSVDRRLHDIGAIKLDCEVGNIAGIMPLTTAAVEDGTNVTVRGYPCDSPVKGRQYLSDDRLASADALKVFYQNDTFGCMSGGPVYATPADGADLGDAASAAIFAVHTNGLHNGAPWSSNNAATRLTPARIALIQSWIAR